MVVFYLGAKAVTAGNMSHLDDAHKVRLNPISLHRHYKKTPANTHAWQKCGAVLFALYLLQCGLGAFIHFIKPTRRPTQTLRRPAQNYVHGALGVLTVALGAAQARSGYAHEWAATTARAAPAWVGGAWWAWVVLVPIAYGGGLVLLKEQFRQERAGPGVEGRGLLEEDGEGEKEEGEEVAMKERASAGRGYREI